ncbi:MAG TPA: TlpA family protein disulfide reductase [Bacteroides sp.]|nr:TlpA family protein disulfide reductase [Bacteroides sp.]
MKQYLIILLLLWLGSVPAVAQDIPEIDRADLARITGQANDTTYVVNFWATWCSPCVKEIGYFEELHREYGASGVSVILVNLDFPNQVDSRVIPFLKERNITAPVMLMTDLQYNEWIDLVDPGWSGAIPATLIYKNAERVFLEQELTREALYDNLHQIHN